MLVSLFKLSVSLVILLGSHGGQLDRVTVDPWVLLESPAFPTNSALTVPNVIFMGQVSEAGVTWSSGQHHTASEGRTNIIEHEATHVSQYEVLGPALIVAYGFTLGRPFENYLQPDMQFTPSDTTLPRCPLFSWVGNAGFAVWRCF